MSERRIESRFLCADIVKVEWLANNFSGGIAAYLVARAGEVRTVLQSAEAVLEDISQQGACVQVDEEILVGSPILISVVGEETARLAGIVSYCVFRDYGYFVGIKLSGETPWSSGVFEPQHLISLEALAAEVAKLTPPVNS
jgi:hypothetical protein